MLKKLNKKQDRTQQAAGRLLGLQVTEIEEISEKLFDRIDEKVKALKSLEARIDRKICSLEGLLERVQKAETAAEQGSGGRTREIIDLAAKGLNIDAIADILDIPKGEIELVLSLRK